MSRRFTPAERAATARVLGALVIGGAVALVAPAFKVHPVLGFFAGVAAHQVAEPAVTNKLLDMGI